MVNSMSQQQQPQQHVITSAMSSSTTISAANTQQTVPQLAKDRTCRRIEQMEAEREERRRAMVERKKARDEEEQRNIAAGNPGDVDFIGMVRTWREEHIHEAKTHVNKNTVQFPVGGTKGNKNDSGLYYYHPRICICVRKRPISEKEIAKLDHDSVTCINPTVWIHSAKLKVDGISKYLDHSSFNFDHAFDETVPTDEIYKHTTMPLVDFVCTGTGGRATVFAYGQTGSGKTHTMSGIQQILTEDLFSVLLGGSHDGREVRCSLDSTRVSVSFFELYGGYVQDLLNDRNRLKILEDGKGEIHVTGLTEMEVYDPETFHLVIEAGNGGRTTHMTEANDTSSRSHAICQVMLKDRTTDKLLGKLSLVDLAGSERGTDTKSHNQQRRTESAEINTSLLTLKECIRALDINKKGGGASTKSHVPYRGSKLTLILKDCFTSDQAMTTMIATVSPGASAADHSINTLRYADRIKSQGNSAGQQNSTHRSGGVMYSSTTHVRIRRRMAAPTIGNDELNDTNDESETARTTTSISKRNHHPVKQQQQQQPQSRQTHNDDDDETLFRQTIEAILEQEENILSTHMSNIQENAELLTVEGDLLSAIQQHFQFNENNSNDRGGGSGSGRDLENNQRMLKNNVNGNNNKKNYVNTAALDDYASALEEILDRKEDMILNLQQHISNFQNLLQHEKELSKQRTRTGKAVPQY